MTFDEIVKDLQKEIAEQWSEEDRARFFLTGYNDVELIDLHHLLGTYIRNKYKLWTVPWEPELRDGVDYSPHHPDNISMAIIEEIWRQGNEKLKEIK